jgi:DNA-binding MarR family transcriptional regulator
VRNEKVTSPGIRYNVLLQLLRTADTVWNASHTLFSRWELTPSQFNVLNLLSDYPDGLIQSDLSRKLITHRSNITGLVDRLERRGLVRRQNSKGDRRAYFVTLTSTGVQMLKNILPHYYQAAELVCERLTIGRVVQLTKDLNDIAQGAHERAEKMHTQEAE